MIDTKKEPTANEFVMGSSWGLFVFSGAPAGALRFPFLHEYFRGTGGSGCSSRLEFSIAVRADPTERSMLREPLHHRLEIGPNRGARFNCVVAQEICRMKGRHHRDGRSPTRSWRIPGCPLAAQFRDPFLNLEDQFCRRTAERHEDLGIHDQDLLDEVGAAQIDFARKRRSIVGWSALEHIGDVAIRTAQSHGLDHLIEFLPSPTDKWPTTLVFGLAWCFAHEKDVSLWITLAKDGLGVTAHAGAVRAFAVVPLAEFFERCSTVGEICRESRRDLGDLPQYFHFDLRRGLHFDRRGIPRDLPSGRAAHRHIAQPEEQIGLYQLSG